MAEKLPEGDNRHLVVTLPKKMGLRKQFQRDTRLHRQIGPAGVLALGVREEPRVRTLIKREIRQSWLHERGPNNCLPPLLGAKHRN